MNATGTEYAADHAVNIATSAVVNVRHNNVTKAKSGKDGWRTIGSGKHKYRANGVTIFSVKKS